MEENHPAAEPRPGAVINSFAFASEENKTTYAGKTFPTWDTCLQPSGTRLSGKSQREECKGSKRSKLSLLEGPRKRIVGGQVWLLDTNHLWAGHSALDARSSHDASNPGYSRLKNICVWPRQWGKEWVGVLYVFVCVFVSLVTHGTGGSSTDWQR